MKPTPDREQLALLDQIVSEKLEIIEGKYGMNLWTLNIILCICYYTDREGK